jgi:hypothetical protein
VRGSIFRDGCCGGGGVVGLSDLCEDCHPIEVAEHFRVMIFSVPSMMQFSYCPPLRLSSWTHVTYGASCLVLNPCFFVIRHLTFFVLVCVYPPSCFHMCLARPAACIIYPVLYPLEMTPFF